MIHPARFLIAIAPLLAGYAALDAAPRESLITFDRPGKKWEAEALPIGNGRIGAMIFGGLTTDRIQFNEISLWTGDMNPSGGYDYGEDKKNIMGCYQNFGDLFVTFSSPSEADLATGSSEDKTKGNFDDTATAPGYRRELNLSTTRVTTDFEKNGVKFHREAFASAADQVVVLRYTADKPGSHSGLIRLKDGHGLTTTAKDGVLSATGGFLNGLRYESRIKVLHEGGTITVKGDTIVFTGCNALTVILGARTNYIGDLAKKFVSGQPGQKLDADFVAAKKPYATLRADAEKAHRQFMDRMEFDIGSTPESLRTQSTAARLAAYKKGGSDPDLEEDLFNYSRYLLISSSRGSLPANLQGLWNDSNKPAWACDYHTNINIQMNYWGSEPVALPEMQIPLVDYVLAQAPAARIAVLADKKQFPKPVRGWTARTSQNITGGNGWNWNIPSSAWYMQHLWEHFAFTRDKEYLRKVAYPAMKEVCNFWEDNLKTLTADGKNFAGDDNGTDRAALQGIKAGTLVAPHGWSPEHGPHEDGVAHDQQIIWDLFTNTAEAATVLGEKATADKYTKLRDRLAGPRIGKWGQLQEWMIDRDDKTDTHRHISPLFAVYPGRQICATTTPELAKAAITLLKARSNDKGDQSFGVDTTIGDSRRSWTWPWRCAVWARLGDGERAGIMVRGLLTHNTLDNLFATHPPFQIDGNLGIGGGISEMLIQSHAGEVQLLPAIPKAWADGSVYGIRARGGFTVGMNWTAGKVVTADIVSNAGEPLRLRAGTPVSVTTGGAPVSATEKDGTLTFPTKAGTTYLVTAK